MKQRPTVAILYGAGEGVLGSKKLRAALAHAGFDVISSPTLADILIAHSGGIFYLPTSGRAKLTLLVGPVTGYRGSALKTQFDKVCLDFRGSYQRSQLTPWIGKTLLNVGYLFVQPHRVAYMWQQTRKHRGELPAVQSSQVAILVFRGDPWSNNLPESGQHSRLPYTFMHFDRLHDDLWINPKDYVTVLQYLYAT
jgi:hypothetical protein